MYPKYLPPLRCYIASSNPPINCLCGRKGIWKASSNLQHIFLLTVYSTHRVLTNLEFAMIHGDDVCTVWQFNCEWGVISTFSKCVRSCPDLCLDSSKNHLHLFKEMYSKLSWVMFEIDCFVVQAPKEEHLVCSDLGGCPVVVYWVCDSFITYFSWYNKQNII